MLTIIGNKVGGTGDRHIDDVYKGAHVDYQENTLWCFDKTLEVLDKSKPDFYFETGDFVGVRNNIATLKDNAMLYETIHFLDRIKCEKVINFGNHDMFQLEDINTYSLLSLIGKMKTPRDIADRGEEIGVVRLVSPDLIDSETGKPMEMYIHFVPYGKEYVQLKPVEGFTNIAVTHNDFRLSSTTFTNNPDAIDLTSHKPFYGIDVILNGHIHQPSNVSNYVTDSGSSGIFINLGCMARPKINENYNMVWYVEFGFRVGVTGIPEVYISPKAIDLRPADEIFIKQSTSATKKDILSQDDVQLQLSTVFEELKDFNWAGVSISERLGLLHIEEPVKKLIFEYYGMENE